MKFNVDFEAGKSDVTIQKATAPMKMDVLLENVATAAVFETEIIPQEGSGLISLRKGFGRLQLVYQVAPQVHTVKWDWSESTQNKKTYQLAEPWKIIISDYDNGSFLGSRHFYSPEAILSYDQPLYAINLPNTNTIGYGGTSIGWICHYHYNDTTQFSISEMINYAVYRESGLNEPYNDANMSGTDGPRFYQKRGAPTFITDPATWQKKTDKEGVDWTLDPNLWQVIKIDWKKTPSAESFAEKGDVYTLGDAVFRPYYCYYPTRKTQPFELPLNIYRRLKKEGKNPWEEKELLTELGQRWRVSKVESKNTKKGSAAAAPVQLSPEEQFENLKKLKIPNIQNLQIKFVSDGEECKRCLEKIKSSEGSLVNIAVKTTSYSAKIRTVEQYLQALDSLSYDKWCQKCINEYGVKIGEQFNYTFNSFVSTDLTEWGMIHDEFFLKISSVQCKFCMSLDYPIDEAHNYLFYDVAKIDKDFWKTTQFGSFVPDLPDNSCCVKCVDLYAMSKKWDSYQVTESSELCPIRFVGANLESRAISFGEELKDNTLFYKFMFTNVSIGGVSPEEPSKVGIYITPKEAPPIGDGTFETKAELVPIEVCKSKGVRICPCNLPSTEKGTAPCAMCLDKKGEYKPFSEQFINTNKVTITPIEVKDPSDA